MSERSRTPTGIPRSSSKTNSAPIRTSSPSRKPNQSPSRVPRVASLVSTPPARSSLSRASSPGTTRLSLNSNRRLTANGRPLSQQATEEFLTACRNAVTDDFAQTVENLETALRVKFEECEAARREARTVSKELAERERALQGVQAALDRQREAQARTRDDLEAARVSERALEAEKRKLSDDLRRANIATKRDDQALSVLQEKHQNLRDLQSYEDRAFKAEQEVKRLVSALVAKEGELRIANTSIKNLEMDMHVCQDKAEEVLRKESANQFAELNKRIADLADENRVLERQVKVMNAAAMDAAFTRKEELEPAHQELLMLQAEVKRLRSKLDVTEHSLKESVESSNRANKRIHQMNDLMRNGWQRRHKHLESPSSPSAPGRQPDSPSMFTHSDEGFKSPNPELGGTDTGDESLSSNSLESVPAALYELVQKELAAVKQEVKQRDRLIRDKDASIEISIHKVDTLERARLLESKRHERETYDMRRELTSLKADTGRKLW
eukprot:CAMPEP_0114244374 /NCGR_PEP_ID=MMETSP0058-20121206/11300_1 /TAXON_ID=36894 /ORGANISM="Pyramimonas parkeae, CCMP726" /LENGTH=497 /DNA_ID=CAMNT_0001357299 /DNA_START=30 /DNA_END=1520 /DNA_ORIENTATION=-